MHVCALKDALGDSIIHLLPLFIIVACTWMSMPIHMFAAFSKRSPHRHPPTLPASAPVAEPMRTSESSPKLGATDAQPNFPTINSKEFQFCAKS